MKEQNKIFAEELAEYVFHPYRVYKISQMFDLDLCDYLDIVS
jgi:hypothetical protein